MKKILIILITCFLAVGTCFSDTPTSPYRNREGWSKSVHFPVSEYSGWNSYTWEAEAFGYELKDFENKKVGYVVAVENPREKICYYSYTQTKSQALEFLQYAQNHYVYIEDMPKIFEPENYWYNTFEAKDGTLWRLEKDQLMLLFVSDITATDEWTEKFLEKVYTDLWEDGDSKTLEEKREAISLYKTFLLTGVK